MKTKPDDFSCATRRSATILDIVSAPCDRASALPLVKASATGVTSSRERRGHLLPAQILDLQTPPSNVNRPRGSLRQAQDGRFRSGVQYDALLEPVAKGRN